MELWRKLVGAAVVASMVVVDAALARDLAVRKERAAATLADIAATVAAVARAPVPPAAREPVAVERPPHDPAAVVRAVHARLIELAARGGDPAAAISDVIDARGFAEACLRGLELPPERRVEIRDLLARLATHALAARLPEIGRTELAIASVHSDVSGAVVEARLAIPGKPPLDVAVFLDASGRIVDLAAEGSHAARNYRRQITAYLAPGDAGYETLVARLRARLRE